MYLFLYILSISHTQNQSKVLNNKAAFIWSKNTVKTVIMCNITQI